jgi:hypothetical protein
MAVRKGAVLRFLLQGRVSRWQIALKSHRRACYKGKGKSEGKSKKKKRKRWNFLLFMAADDQTAVVFLR